jgi:phage-related protein
MIITKFFELRLYQEMSGKIPLLEWLKDFNKEDRKIIDRDIKYTQYSWPWKMPLIKPLGGGLMEIRIKLKDKQVRIFFILHDGIIVLLHGFIKKTQKTPNNEITIALKRIKQLKQK